MYINCVTCDPYRWDQTFNMPTTLNGGGERRPIYSCARSGRLLLPFYCIWGLCAYLYIVTRGARADRKSCSSPSAQYPYGRAQAPRDSRNFKNLWLKRVYLDACPPRIRRRLRSPWQPRCATTKWNRLAIVRPHDVFRCGEHDLWLYRPCAMVNDLSGRVLGTLKALGMPGGILKRHPYPIIIPWSSIRIYLQ